MITKISETIEKFQLSLISKERKEILQPLIDYIQLKLDKKEAINLNFICTHNSRRSHLSQIWAQTIAFYYGVQRVKCYSGGTDVTAIYPKVIETLQNHGFEIQKLSHEKNPIYAIKFSENELPIIGFSKVFDDNFNPKSNFVAIMTCSQADEGCPFIMGAEKRFPIRYDDPKEFDETILMNEKYEERSLQIALEMTYVFSNLKNEE